MKKEFLLLLLSISILSCNPQNGDNIVIYPAPEGEELNPDYKLTANGSEVPVYNAKIGHEDRATRHKAMDIPAESHLYYDVAGFAYFDLKKGAVELEVSVDKPVQTAKVLPASLNIQPEINGNLVRFSVDKPLNVTVEINGEHIRSLHIFVNPEETHIPNPDDPDVIYFAPGIHELSGSIEVPDNKTVYVAGGAIIRCCNDTTVDTNDKEAVKKSLWPSFVLSGNNARIRGRGIIDQENVPRMQAKNIMRVTGKGLEIDGVILRNSSIWTVSLNNAEGVNINNIKVFGHRANSDGIDICDSWDVVVQNCFLRTLDDLIVVKTFRNERGAGNILAQNCVLWNEVAHALSIGAELKHPVDGVTFRDCDIIGDHCREWSLRIYQSDKGVIKNIQFEDIRIEEAVKFASLWINESYWSTDAERGHIENVVFKNIMVNSPQPLEAGMEFLGFDEGHAIKNVLIENVVVQGKKVTKEDIVMNEFVYNVEVK